MRLRQALCGVDRAVARILSEQDVRRRPPIDIGALASRYGARVELAPIDQDGFMVDEGSSAILVVRESDAWARRRFTAAHELAHWLIRGPHARTVGIDHVAAAFRSEEMLCNSFAAALLMPLEWLRGTFYPQWGPDTAPRFALIAELARQTDSSLAAATVRMRDVFNWPSVALHWAYLNGAWHYAGEAGLFPWEQGAVSPSRNVDLVLAGLRADRQSTRSHSTDAVKIRLPLSIERREDDHPAEVIFQGNTASALIELPGRLAPRGEQYARACEARNRGQGIAWSMVD